MSDKRKQQSVEIIDAPEGEKHLDLKWIPEIPVNCIFNKVITGCGATTLAIKQVGHTIIAMPYVSLVKNKEIQHKDTVLGVYERVTETDIIDYIKSHSTHKIAVTYDSVPKVASILQANGINVFKDYFLLVDEWQVLVNSYDFRYDAVRALLDETRKFERVTYVSATPIERCYRLEELQNIREVTVNWPNTSKIPINTYLVNKPADCVAELCQNYDAHKGHEGENWHFFVNSVDFISKVLRKAWPTPNPANVKVVCSKSRENKRRNEAKLGTVYPIAEPLDPVKRFNFYTSTCFEGCDLYDENGLTIIVNDGNVPHTLLDIGTLFTQIAGRIRNSEYNKEGIIHIFSPTRYNKDVSLEEYIRTVEKEYGNALCFADRINANNGRDDIEKLHTKEKYTRIENGRIVVDRNLVISDILAYQLRNFTYNTGALIVNSLEASNFDVIEKAELHFENMPYKAAPRINFENAFKRYCELKSPDKILSLSAVIERDDIERMNPLVKEAYCKLGAEAVEMLEYNTTKVKRELAKKLDAPIIAKLIKMIKHSIPYHTRMPDAEIKGALQGIYNELGINRTAKSTDLAEWYEIKKTSPKINGTSVASTAIIYEKIAIIGQIEDTQSGLSDN